MNKKRLTLVLCVSLLIMFVMPINQMESPTLPELESTSQPNPEEHLWTPELDHGAREDLESWQQNMEDIGFDLSEDMENLTVGEPHYSEHSNFKFLGYNETDGRRMWQVNTTIGELNTRTTDENGTKYWAPYVWNDTTRTVEYAGCTLEFYDWYATLRNATSGVVIVDDIRWTLEYWSDLGGGRWQVLDLWDHSFLEPVLDDPWMTFGQSYTDGSTVMNVTYVFKNADTVKINVTLVPEVEHRYRLRWQLTGMNNDPTFIQDDDLNDVSAFFGTFGVNGSVAERELTFKWGDVNQTDVEVWHDWSVAGKKLDVYFGNITIAADEEWVLDPSWTVDADADDCNFRRTNPSGSWSIYTGASTIHIWDQTGNWEYQGFLRITIEAPRATTWGLTYIYAYERDDDGAHTSYIKMLDGAGFDPHMDTAPESLSSRPTDYEAGGWATYGWDGDDTNEWDNTGPCGSMFDQRTDQSDWEWGMDMGFVWYQSSETAGVEQHEFESHDSAFSNEWYVSYSITEPDYSPVVTNAVVDNPTDTDNLYAQYSATPYTITVELYHENGYSDMDYVDLNVESVHTGGTNFFNLEWDQDTGWSEGINSDHVELVTGSCSATYNYTQVTLVFAFHVDWDITAPADAVNYDLRVLAYDDDADSDIEGYDLNYDFYVELDILSYAITDDAGQGDWGDLNEAYYASGNIRYASATTRNPLDSEMDLWLSQTEYGSQVGPWEEDTPASFNVTGYYDNVYGQDTATFKVVPEGDGSGGTNLLDATHTDLIVADEIIIQTTTTQDGRINRNTAADIRVTATSRHSTGHSLGSADTLYMNDTSMTWSTDHFKLSPSFDEVGLWNFYVNSTNAYEATYGVTGVILSGNDVDQIWDEIEVYWSDIDDSRTNKDESEPVKFRIRWKYDSMSVNDTNGGSVSINGSSASWSGAGGGYWYRNYAQSSVGSWNFLITAVSETDYGITALDSSSATTYSQDIIWDEIEVYSGAVPDGRVDIETNTYPYFQLRLKYDNTLLNDGSNDNAYINGSIATWGVGDTAWYLYQSRYYVTGQTYVITSAYEDTYGISALDTTSATTFVQTIIWDAITYTMWLSDARDNVGDTVGITAWLTHAYDGTNVTSGTVTFSSGAGSYQSGGEWMDWIAESSVGLYSHNITAVNSQYDITAIGEIQFDGDADYVTFSTISTSARTQMGWFKFEELASVAGSSKYFFSNLYLHTANDYVYPYGASSSHLFMWTPTLDVWYHITFVIPDKTNSTQCRLFIDGIEISITLQGEGLVGDFVRVGSSSTTAFEGGIMSVKVFDTVLTDEQIYAEYQGFPHSSDVVLDCPITTFDVEDGIWYDTSSSGNDGTINNAVVNEFSGTILVRPIFDRIYMTDWLNYDQWDNVGDNIIHDCRFYLEYDNFSLNFDGSGTYTAEGASMTWAGGSMKWYRTTNYAYATNETFTISAVGEITYGINAFANSSWSDWNVWDILEVYDNGYSDAHADINDPEWVLFGIRSTFDPTLHINTTGVDFIWINGSAATYYAPSDQWYLSVSQSTVGNWTYVATAATWTLYDITAFNTTAATEWVRWMIWDRFLVIGYDTTVSDNRYDTSTASDAWIQIRYEYDEYGTIYLTDGTLTINGVSGSYFGSSGYWNFTSTYGTPTVLTYDTLATGGDDTQSMSAVNQNSQDITIYWDFVSVIEFVAELTNGDSPVMYAKYKYYFITANVSDTDGYADIDTILVLWYDDARSTNYWTVKFDQDTSTFSIVNGSSYITLQYSSYVESGDWCNVTFSLKVDWDHPDLSSCDTYTWANDSVGLLDAQWDESDWDVETRLDWTGLYLTDSSGTIDRGDLDGTFTWNGTVVYYGSAYNPFSNETDIWITADVYGSSAGPWSNTTFTSGVWLITCYADDVASLMTLTLKVVEVGAGSGGTDLYYTTSVTDTYISDMICWNIWTGDSYGGQYHSNYIWARITYAYDGLIINSTYASAVTFSLNGTPTAMTYQSAYEMWRGSTPAQSTGYWRTYVTDDIDVTETQHSLTTYQDDSQADGLLLDGEAGDEIVFSSDADYDVDNIFSIAITFKALWIPDHPYSGFLLRVHIGSTDYITIKIRYRHNSNQSFYISFGNGPQTDIYTGTFNTTYQMVVTCGGADDLNIWINGTLNSFHDHDYSIPSSSTITIGDDDDSGNWLRARIYEVMMWDVELTSTQAAMLLWNDDPSASGTGAPQQMTNQILHWDTTSYNASSTSAFIKNWAGNTDGAKSGTPEFNVDIDWGEAFTVTDIMIIAWTCDGDSIVGEGETYEFGATNGIYVNFTISSVTYAWSGVTCTTYQLDIAAGTSSGPFDSPWWWEWSNSAYGASLNYTANSDRYWFKVTGNLDTDGVYGVNYITHSQSDWLAGSTTLYVTWSASLSVLRSNAVPDGVYTDENVTLSTLLDTDYLPVSWVIVKALTAPAGFSDVEYTCVLEQQDLYTYTFMDLPAGYYAFQFIGYDGVSNTTLTEASIVDFQVLEIVLDIRDFTYTSTSTENHLSGLSTADCNYYIYENDTYISVTGVIVSGSFSITWTKNTTIALYRWGVKFNDTVTTRWVNGSYEVTTETLFGIQDTVYTATSTMNYLGGYATLGCTWTAYNNDSQKNTGSIIATGSFQVEWEKDTAEGNYVWGVKFVNGSTTLWVNGTFEVTSTTFLISDPTVSVTTTTVTVSAFANLAGNYYVYSNDSYQSVSGAFVSGSVVVTWNKLTAVALHVWAVKFNVTDGTTRWVNGSYDVTSTTFSLTWSFGVSDTKAFVTGYKNLAATYTVYENDGLIASGSITSLSFWLEWSRRESETPGEVDVAVSFTNGTTTIWLNWSYTEAQLLVFAVDTWWLSVHLGVENYVEFFVKTTYGNATIDVYDNGTLQTTVLEQEGGVFSYFWMNTLTGLHEFQLNITHGSTTFTRERTYYVPDWAETALVLRWDLWTFQNNYTMISLESNWRNCTFEVYLNDSLVASSLNDPVTLNFTRDINVGEYNLTLHADGGTQTYTVLNIRYVIVDPDTAVVYDYSEVTYNAGGHGTFIYEGDTNIDVTQEPALYIDEQAGEWIFWSVIILILAIPMAVLGSRIIKLAKDGKEDKLVSSYAAAQKAGKGKG